MAPVLLAVHQLINRILNKIYGNTEPDVRMHMGRVYMFVSGAAACAIVAAFLQFYGLFDITEVATPLSLLFTKIPYVIRGHPAYNYIRRPFLMLLAFSSGQSLALMMQYTDTVNLGLVITVLIVAVVSFISLTLGGLLARRRLHKIVLNSMGLVNSALDAMSVVNQYFEFVLVGLVQRYIFAFVVAAAVVFDTQIIVEKRRAGNQDVEQHASGLIFDALTLFRHLLLIKMKKELIQI